MDRLRLPFFILALFVLAVIVGVELAASWLIGTAAETENPGWGIPFLAIIDLILAYAVGMMALGMFVPRSLQGRLQGLISLILSFLGLLGTIALVMLALAVLGLMVSLLLAVPFGTLAYMALWGTFPEGEARVALSLIMTLKLGFCVLLLLAQQRFVKNIGLVVLIAASLVLTWLVGFLQAFPPGFLVAIVDVIAAIIIGVVGAVWLLVMLIGSLFAIVSALKSVPAG